MHTFSYRSKKDTAFLEARLSYRITGNPNPISFYTRSKIEVTKDFWNDCIKNTKFKDVEKINLKKEIDDHTHDLRKYLLNEFDKTDLSQINKEIYLAPPYLGTRSYQENEDNLHNKINDYIKNSPYKIYISSYEWNDLTIVKEISHRSILSATANNKIVERLFCNQKEFVKNTLF